MQPREVCRCFQVVRVVVWLLITAGVGLKFLESASRDLNSDTFVEDQHHHLISRQKNNSDGTHENSTVIGQRDIVQNSTVAELRSALLATLGIEVIVCPFLVLFSLVALVGTYQTSVRFIRPWLCINAVWFGSLIIILIIHIVWWGFDIYALTPLSVLVFAAVCELDVGHFARSIPRASSYDVTVPVHDLEMSEEQL